MHNRRTTNQMKGQIPVNSKSQSMGQSSRKPRRSPQNCKTNGGQNYKEKGQDPSLLQITEQNYSAQPSKQWPGTARRAGWTTGVDQFKQPDNHCR